MARPVSSGSHPGTVFRSIHKADPVGRVMQEICPAFHTFEDPCLWEGAHVVSTDEMTGVQALEHKYPNKLPLPGQCANAFYRTGLPVSHLRAFPDRPFQSSARQGAPLAEQISEKSVSRFLKMR